MGTLLQYSWDLRAGTREMVGGESWQMFNPHFQGLADNPDRFLGFIKKDM